MCRNYFMGVTPNFIRWTLDHKVTDAVVKPDQRGKGKKTACPRSSIMLSAVTLLQKNDPPSVPLPRFFESQDVYELQISKSRSYNPLGTFRQRRAITGRERTMATVVPPHRDNGDSDKAVPQASSPNALMVVEIWKQ